MKPTVRQPLDPDTHNRWARTAHLLALEAIVGSNLIQPGQLVFHGGTSLRLVWNSPRYSEDLDFLLDKQVNNVETIMKNAVKRISERFHAIDPLFTVESANKSKDESRLGAHMLTISHPSYYGVVKVKAEFWMVDSGYLESYPTALKMPHPEKDVMAKVSTLIKAAELETAFCDKLTALATRPFLKWRDMFDIWWIGTQTDTELDTVKIIEQFRHNLSAYKTKDGLPAAEVFRQFVAQDREAIMEKADPDLKKWLPEQFWSQLKGEGVRQIVDYTYDILETVVRGLDEDPTLPQALPKNPPRPRGP